MPSFDTVCEADFVEVKNAVDNAAKEVGTRFDFKGTSAAIELKDKEITLTGDADFQLQQLQDILRAKLTKRSVDVRFLDVEKPQKAGGDKLKLQAAIQDGKVRVTGAKRDDLQAAMALLRKEVADLPLTFDNFRD